MRSLKKAISKSYKQEQKAMIAQKAELQRSNQPRSKFFSIFNSGLMASVLTLVVTLVITLVSTIQLINYENDGFGIEHNQTSIHNRLLISAIISVIMVLLIVAILIIKKTRQLKKR